MAIQRYPLPIIDKAKFELEHREEAVRHFLPAFMIREPRAEDISDHKWAIEGVLVPGQEERALLAANIGDLIDPDKAEDDPNRLIASGLEIATMLSSARLGRLAREFPGIDKLDGDEVTIVIPRGEVTPLYEAGMLVDPESNFAHPPAIAEPAGRVASNGAGIVPVPLQQAA